MTKTITKVLDVSGGGVGSCEVEVVGGKVVACEGVVVAVVEAAVVRRVGTCWGSSWGSSWGSTSSTQVPFTHSKCDVFTIDTLLIMTKGVMPLLVLLGRGYPGNRPSMNFAISKVLLAFFLMVNCTSISQIAECKRRRAHNPLKSLNIITFSGRGGMPL